MALSLNGTTGISGIDGSASTPAVQGTDTNTGLFYGVDTVSIATNGTERVKVNSSGQTEHQAGSVSAPAITASGDLDTGVFFSAANTVDVATNGTAGMQLDSSQNLKFNSGYGSVATAYGCRAWVNFNGTSTVAIRASGNVTSITDNGTGDYTVNFTNAMPDANFAVNVNYSPIYGTYYCAGARLFGNTALSEVAPSVNNFRFVTHFITGNEQDPKYVIVSVFR